MALRKLLLALFALSFSAIGHCNPVTAPNFASSEIITSDFVIIGGGSSGTYAATRLRESGKTITLIEREAVLGGHVNTYHDPVTGLTFDYGVVYFYNMSVVTNYFEHYNVPLGPPNDLFSTNITYYANFATATPIPNDPFPSDNALGAALFAYVDQLAKYPFLSNGYNLPTPVPADLLLNFGDFVAKYQLQGMVYTAFYYLQGIGNILDQLTLYILKYLPAFTVQSILTGAFITTVHHNNHQLYDNALAAFGSSALVSSTVTQVIRFDDGVEVVVCTPSGTKLIKASKLLIAIQPNLDSLKFMDFDIEERSLFGQFNNSYYWDALIRNPGLPTGACIDNANTAAALALPDLPGMYSICSTVIPDVYSVDYTSPYALSDDFVKKDILKTTAKLVKAFEFPPVNGTPEFVGFNNHSPYELTVSTDAISSGFYDKLNALQGKRNTWYTGATWQEHDSSLIWNWTEYTLLPKMLAV
ncbi:flavin-containing superfamily amine oxidase [Hyaloscypha hepaticicola]|uniref:Flavin-containing superfamily amine oxidase n=1 Tax=Hyaloscypha hepaticicola TaxID=2082293 RepID=A0A2J6QIE0_9HELO|nr:flavin-containing superfamily amine oxidase [Hyaloscypha hepaticicola]